MTQMNSSEHAHIALMGVIARETDAFMRRDFAAWSTCWVQDARTSETCVSSAFGTTVLQGWEQFSTYMRGVFESGNTCDLKDLERANISVTQSGDLAYVSYDEYATSSNGRVETTYETRVLERADGQWRILAACFVVQGHQQIDTTRLAVNAKGDVLCAPEGALKQLENHQGLRISNNRLRATRPAWDLVLQDGLKRAAEQHGYFQHYRYMVESGQNFRLPLVLGETDEGNVTVCVLFVRDGLTFVETQEDGDVQARLNIAKLVFGLSQGQMMLAERIVCGDNLKTASSLLGISINTARTHLSRIYVKTGVNSQTALVRSLLSVG